MIQRNNLEVGLRVEFIDRPGTITAVDAQSFRVRFDDGTCRDGEIPASLGNLKLAPTGSAAEAMDWIRRALADESNHFIAPPRPSGDDIALAKSWCNGDEHLHRMLSARLAERAVAMHHEQRGREVQDVALTQLIDSENDGDWKNFDLKVDGIPIDVKNATRSRTRPKRYVAHCVPRFKKTRQCDMVEIEGAVSEWCHLDGLRRMPPSVLLLGRTGHSFVRQLQADLSTGPLRMKLRHGLSSPRFLPPWLFSYDISYYTQRDKTLGALRSLDPGALDTLFDYGLNPVPLYLAGLLELEEAAKSDLTKTQQRFVEALCTRIGRHGVSLAVVFLTILEGFLISIIQKETFGADDLYPILFFEKHRNRPLLLHDPLLTIHGLIETLDMASKNGESKIREFRTFLLDELNILLGQRPNDQDWMTVMAYCGGWVDGNPCGNIPLVIGQHMSCDCSKLICDLCGFCSTVCEQGAQRGVGTYG